MPASFLLTPNPRADRSRPLPDAAHEVVRPEAVARAAEEIPSWPAYRPTPLRSLASLAETNGVGEIWYKDEADRFGVGSFKPMGGGYAVSRVVARHVERVAGLERVAAKDLLSGRYADLAAEVTVTGATDGNHGRAIAWAAERFGCRAVIYMASIVSPARERAMVAYGADVVRSRGNHEVASEECSTAASRNGWYVVSETDRATEPDIAHDIMAGYRTLLEEIWSEWSQGSPPTHLFIQAGVGGLAAAACVFAAEHWPAERPVMVVVESDRADCIRRSIEAGAPIVVDGALDTIMAGLAAGEASRPAWSILSHAADFAMAIPDAAAVSAMRSLADLGIVGGESGVAGLAAALVAASDEEAQARLGLTPESRIVTIGTEGATDPDVYERLVGRAPAAVLSGPAVR